MNKLYKSLKRKAHKPRAIFKARTGLSASSLLQPLEPRILFDASTVADINAVISDAAAFHPTDADLAQAGHYTNDALNSLITDHTVPLVSDNIIDHSANPIVDTKPIGVIFVDSNIKDYDVLINDIIASNTNEYKIFIINNNQSGIAQISTDLESFAGNVSSIHILSHSNNGAINIGNTALSSQNVVQYTSEISGWSHALTQDADILIYGCNLTQTTDGMQLVQTLSELTSADIAASNNLTGIATNNTDLNFETQIGTIEAQSVLHSGYNYNWHGALPTNQVYVVDNSGDVADGNYGAGQLTLREAIQLSNANPSSNPNAIYFHSSLVNSGAEVTLNSLLPQITSNVTIDGLYDYAAGQNRNIDILNHAQPVIEITSSVNLSGNFLYIHDTSEFTLKGLEFTFAMSGDMYSDKIIYAQKVTTVTIDGNYFNSTGANKIVVYNLLNTQYINNTIFTNNKIEQVDTTYYIFSDDNWSFYNTPNKNINYTVTNNLIDLHLSSPSQYSFSSLNFFQAQNAGVVNATVSDNIVSHNISYFNGISIYANRSTSSDITVVNNTIDATQYGNSLNVGINNQQSSSDSRLTITDNHFTAQDGYAIYTNTNNNLNSHLYVDIERNFGSVTGAGYTLQFVAGNNNALTANVNDNTFYNEYTYYNVALQVSETSTAQIHVTGNTVVSAGYGIWARYSTNVTTAADIEYIITGNIVTGFGAGAANAGISTWINNKNLDQKIYGEISGNTVSNHTTGIRLFHWSYQGASPFDSFFDVKQNIMFNNTELGIDIVTGGDDQSNSLPAVRTPNDLNDVDNNGGNLVQNFPVLTSLTYDITNGYTITGTLNSEANEQYRIDFYESDDVNKPQGQKWLGSKIVTTSGNNASFNESFASVLHPGASDVTTAITATATRISNLPVAGATGATSEFSGKLVIGIDYINLVASVASAAEPNTNGQFTVTLTSPSATDTVISYTVSGTATSATDYTALSGTVTILAGQTSAIININVLDDQIYDNNETVTVTLTGITSGDNSILIGDTPSDSVLITDNEVYTRGNDSFTLDLNNQSQLILYGYQLFANDANENYGYYNSTLTSNVTTAGGTVYNYGSYGNPTYYYTPAPGFTGNDSFQYTSVDEQGNPINITVIIRVVQPTEFVNLIANIPSAAEPSTNGQFTVTLTHASVTDTVISYSVYGSATPDSDYTALTGTVTILAGQTSAMINVNVLDDQIVAGDDNETVIVQLNSITSGSNDIGLGNNVYDTITITNNDIDTRGQDTLTLDLRNQSALYISGNYQLFQNDPVPNYSLFYGGTLISNQTTAGGSIYKDGPYYDPTYYYTPAQGFTGTDSFQYNTYDQNFNTLTVTVFVNVIQPNLVNIASTANAIEPSADGQFTVSLQTVSNTDTIISYGVSGSATSGSDYTALSGTVTILAGQTSAIINVGVLDDNYIESNETVIVTLTGVTSNDSNITLGTATSNITIVDDGNDTAIETNLVYVVDNAGDTSDGDYSSGQLTFREAIELSNANAANSPNVIYFHGNLIHAGAEITLGNALPQITSNVIIDGLYDYAAGQNRSFDILNHERPAIEITSSVNLSGNLFYVHDTSEFTLKGLEFTIGMSGNIYSDKVIYTQRVESVTIDGNYFNSTGVNKIAAYNFFQTEYANNIKFTNNKLEDVDSGSYISNNDNWNYYNGPSKDVKYIVNNNIIDFNSTSELSGRTAISFSTQYAGNVVFDISNNTMNHNGTNTSGIFVNISNSLNSDISVVNNTMLGTGYGSALSVNMGSDQGSADSKMTITDNHLTAEDSSAVSIGINNNINSNSYINVERNFISTTGNGYNLNVIAQNNNNIIMNINENTLYDYGGRYNLPIQISETTTAHVSITNNTIMSVEYGIWARYYSNSDNPADIEFIITGNIVTGLGGGSIYPGISTWTQTRNFDIKVYGEISGNTISNHNTGIRLFHWSYQNMWPYNSFFDVKENIMFGNTGLAIDIITGGDDQSNDQPAVRTTNDLDDYDYDGANLVQNFPVLTNLTYDSTNGYTISGTLNSEANEQYRIDFYESDDINNPQGQKWIGSTLVTTNGNNTSFNESFASVLHPGSSTITSAITATATRISNLPVSGATGATSEFSDALVIDIGTNITDYINITANTPNAGEPNTDGQFTVTLSNASATDTVISYNVAGSATAGSDYTALTGTVTILAGETSAIINIAVLDDNLLEDHESIVITLTGITSGDSSIGLGTNVTDTVTIDDNESDDVATTNEDSEIYIDVLANDFDNTNITITEVTQSINGGYVELQPDGTIFYVPPADFNGDDSFTYTTDSGDIATVTIHVLPVADIPTTTINVAEDSTLGEFDDNRYYYDVPLDQFEDYNAALDSITVNPTHGSVEISGNTIIYAPLDDYYGPDSFTYTVLAGGVLETITVNVNVTPVADIVNQDIFVAGNGSTTLVTGDKFENKITPLVVTFTNGSHGTAAYNQSTGIITYTPNTNYTGPDTFIYSVQSNGATETATVRVVVANPQLTVNEDSSNTLNLSNRFINGQGDLFVPDSGDIGGAQNGTVSIVGGIITYTPNPNFNGTDSFTYTFTSDDITETATVTVHVHPVNDNGDNDTAITNEDTPVTITVVNNDIYTGTVTVGTAPAHGSIVVNGDKTITYTPTADYNGADSFTYAYTAADGSVEAATVNVTVNPVVDAGDNDTATTNEDTPVTITVVTNDIYAGTVTAGTAPAHGSIVVNGDKTITYTPTADYNGPDSFTYTYTAANGSVETATVNVTVNPVNDAGDNDTATTNEDTLVNIPVTGNDIFAGTLSVTGTSTNGGTIAVGTNGTSIDYTPAANFNGSDTFTYTYTAANGSTETATVTVTVTPVNDNTDNDSITTNEDTPVTITVVTNDIYTGTVTAGTAPAHGSIVVNGDKTITYTPTADYNGPDSFTYTYTAADGSVETATVTLTVTATADAITDTVTTLEDTNASFNVFTNDTFAPGRTLTNVVINGTAHGSIISFDSAGNIIYKPDADYNNSTPDTLTYTVTDAHGNTETGTININVTPVTDTVNDNLTTDAGVPVTANILTGTNGASGDHFASTMTLTGATAPTYGSLTWLPNGEITYTPYANYTNGTDSFIYSVQTQDSNGVTTTETATVFVTVNPVGTTPTPTPTTTTTSTTTDDNGDVLSTIVPDSADEPETEVDNTDSSISDNGNVIESTALESQLDDSSSDDQAADSSSSEEDTEENTDNSSAAAADDQSAAQEQAAQQLAAEQQVAQQESMASSMQSSTPSNSNSNSSNSSSNSSSESSSSSSSTDSGNTGMVTTAANTVSEAAAMVVDAVGETAQYAANNPGVAIGTIAAGAAPGIASAIGAQSAGTAAFQSSASSMAGQPSSVARMNTSTGSKANMSNDRKKNEAKLTKVDHAEFEQSEEREAMEVCQCPTCMSIKSYGPKKKDGQTE